MLPELDGLMVCQAMRSDPETALIPIIMVTARSEEADRIAGLELGADDYVTKPFSPKELAARVAALLRRLNRVAATGSVLRYGTITIDSDKHTVTAGDEEVRLTAKEFLLLQYLLQHRGRVLSRDLLLTDVWGYQYTGGTRTVDVHIRRLREKLPVLRRRDRDGQAVRLQADGWMTFRTRSFILALLTAGVTLAVAVTMVSWTVRRTVEARIERTLVDEARLAAETLAHRRSATLAELDAEADALRKLVSARVTFIGADGSVVGDSELSLSDLATAENHADRPEVQQARAQGLGVARRYSATIGTDMLYVAVPVQNPEAPTLAQVRLALPLTEVREQLSSVRRSAAVAAAAGLVTALALAWAASLLLSRRVQAIAAVASRYAAGDFSRSARDFGTDEIGTVARVLDDSIRELGRRAAELSADRARMQAILAGMVEGVLVVNDAGPAAAREPGGAAHAPPHRRRRRTPLPRDRAASGHRRAGRRGAARQPRRRARAAAAAGSDRRRAQRAGRGQASSAPSSCSTTSPICGAPIASGATSSPTCRTSCARR